MTTDIRLERLATLNAIGEIVNREADFRAAAREVLQRLTELTRLSTGWVFVTAVERGDAHEGGFRLAAQVGLPPALAVGACRPLREGSCECQGLLRRGELEHGVNMVECSRLASAEGERGGLVIHASVPLLGPAGPVGILNLAAPGERRFDDEMLQFLAAIGKQLGAAFERWRLQETRTDEARYAAALEERQRLARAMHDSLAQQLFAAELALRVAQEGAGAEREALDRAAELVSQSLVELRSLVEVMRPPDLSAGLASALTRLAERVSPAGPRVVLELSAGAPPPDLSPEAGEALFLIAQEGLHNALRHASASRLWLRLGERDGAVLLRVEDDGRGLPDALSPGVGLESMRERARSLGGSLRLLPREGGGTVVEASLPPPRRARTGLGAPGSGS